MAVLSLCQWRRMAGATSSGKCALAGGTSRCFYTFPGEMRTQNQEGRFGCRQTHNKETEMRRNEKSGSIG